MGGLGKKLVDVSEGDDMGSVVFVDQAFCRDWPMCPMAVAMECGGYLRTSLEVNPGNLVTCFISSDVQSVERAGENKAACAKATRDGRHWQKRWWASVGFVKQRDEQGAQ